MERCPCDCKNLPEFTADDAAKALKYLTPPDEAGLVAVLSITEIPYDRLTEGMNEEREHCDVTGGDAILTAKIALAHIREDSGYYKKLKAAGL